MQINIGYYLRHELLFGNKLQTLHPDYIPFKHPEKIKQYHYQKQMSFQIPKLKQAFVKKYPELINTVNWWKCLYNIKYHKGQFETDKLYLKSKLGQDLYKTVISMFSKCIDFHNHIFKATEKYRQNLYAISYIT